MIETITQPVGAVGDSQPVNLSQAAEMLRLSRLTVRRWLEKGRFPGAHRLGLKGSDWVIPLDDVRAVAQAREKERHPMDAQIIERLDEEYMATVAALATSAYEFLQTYNVMGDDVRRAGGTPPVTPERMAHVEQCRQALNRHVQVVEEYHQVAAARLRVELLAAKGAAPEPPDDVGSFPRS